MHRIRTQALKLMPLISKGRGFGSKLVTLGSLRGTRALLSASMLLYGYSTLQGLKPLASMEEDLHFVEACSVEDLAEGQLREAIVGPDQKNDMVLVVKVDGEVYAIGPKCSHLGAPLLRGVIFGDRLYCPYHLASFSIKDGYHDLGPTYRALPTYKVEIRDGKVFVQVPRKLDNGGRDVPMVSRDPSDPNHYVLVGGGPASLSAAETLRQAGFKGRITMVTKEAVLPYDRTMLTKIPLKSDASLEIRKRDFFARWDIDVLTDTEVIKVDFDRNEISLKDKGTLGYTKLLLAPGASAKLPHIAGNNLQGVFTVRELKAMQELQAYVKAQSPKNVVVVGGSFVGAEIASALKLDNPALQVTILNREKSLYFKNLGETVGGHLDKVATASGVGVRNKTVVSEIKGEDGRVREVLLDDGTTLAADLLILGTGSEFNTDFLIDELKDDKGAIKVDKNFRTSKANVFAAGDATALADFGGVSVQHYSEAINQGTHAAWNMAGRNKPYIFAPFFWTRIFNKGLQFVGVPQHFDEVVLKGDLDSSEFVAIYCQQDDCHSASGMNKTREIVTLNHALRLGLPLKKEQVKQPDFFKNLEEEIKKKGHVCNCTRRKTNENKAE